MKDLILGIETSCDDTCACLMSVIDGRIEYNRSIHQDEVHREFGGIVPNLASGEHLKHIEMIKEDLQKQDLLRVACIAVTTGPGLIGSLLVGVSFAKGLAMSLGIPLLRINHLEGHAVSCMIENEDKMSFPYLLLLVSGGNSQVILAKDLGKYRIIGQTLDDAGGEALDKIAKNLGIEYPGGVNMEKVAEKATDREQFKFKDGCINNKTFDFSFSGLKTQVLRKVESLGGIDNIDKNTISNLAYASQEAVFDTLVKKVKQAIKYDNEVADLIGKNQLRDVVICGGVSANKRLSQKMQELANDYNLQLIVPSLKWTTDNAGMIAKAGCMYWNRWRKNNQPLGYGLNYNTMDLSFSPVARWEVDKIGLFS